ncbi:MAG: ABC transporter ATP-binding protein [Anaeroplasmataceae bacterium]
MHGHVRVIENKKVSKKSVLKLGKYLKVYTPILIFAMILNIAGAICTVLGPEYLGKITTECQMAHIFNRNVDLSYVKSIGIKLIIIYSTSAVCAFLANFLITGAVQRSSRKIRKDISEKINALPLSYFDSRPYGDVLSRVTNDVDTISQNLNQSLNQVIYAVSLLIGVIVMMFKTSWILSLVTIAVLPISLILMACVMKFSQKYFRLQQQTIGTLNGHIEEMYAGQNIVKIFNKEEDNLKDFNNINDSLENSAFKSQFLSGLVMPIMSFVGNLVYIAIAIVGGKLTLTSRSSIKLTLGEVQSFIQYSRLFNQPIQTIGQLSSILQSCGAATERIIEFLNEKELPLENPKLVLNKEDIKGEIEFEHIRFSYNESREIIHDFSCKVLPGQKVAIVGPTGAGKTTMVNLLMRFYEINGGSIKIDGVSTKDITRENVASLFGMVLQDTWLFEGTIMENLRYGNQNASYDEVKEACKACHIHQFIKSLSGGYDHILDENANVSQGQKQLMTIARAMIENAPMLILDEATSSVDTRTEIIIQRAMDKLMEGRTSFVIAHRLSTIKNADLILVMKDGNIIESGNHKELLSKNGFYAELYNSQFSNN